MQTVTYLYFWSPIFPASQSSAVQIPLQAQSIKHQLMGPLNVTTVWPKS